MLALATLLLTTIIDAHRIAQAGIPQIERDLVTAAALIARQPVADAPLVLAECGAGNLLPGLAPLRVYAGHWALTPDDTAKCRRLAAAGIEPGQGPAIEPALDALLADLHPAYAILRNTAPALPWLSRRPAASVLWQSGRWTVFRLGS